jgi:hypothetical protein
MADRRRERTSGGAAEPRTDIRASSASPDGSKSCTSRAISYWCTSRRPNSSGSSAPSATGTPSETSARTGTAARSGSTPSATLDDGHTSQVTPSSASRLTKSGSSTARTPCPIRDACSRSSAATTLAGPVSSPACGTRSSPARLAMRKARSKSSAGPRRSSLDRPRPTTPRPANCAASRAIVRASRGCLVRLAARMIAIPVPVAADASRAASSNSSVNDVMPPYLAAKPDGSACNSSQPEPSARSSSAISRISRRKSAGVRSTERAVSYSRWNRNQPRSSAVDSRGGHSSVRAGGSAMPCCPASSTMVEWRIAPVRWRCRCALGSARRSCGGTAWFPVWVPGGAVASVSGGGISPSWWGYLAWASSFAILLTPSSRSASPRA